MKDNDLKIRITEAVAQAWCTDENKHKEMDSTLAMAIVDLVLPIASISGAGIELGKKYRDKVHGIEGIATCQSRHLSGCDRVCLERVDEKGEIKDHWIDVTRVADIEIPKEVRKPGGPQKTPPARGIK